ncbi:hypothetical protein V1506DRAFT_528202, partial [Lipomyces tetrasporus]
MASYSLPAQCDVRSKLIASCALFLLCDLVRLLLPGTYYSASVLRFVVCVFRFAVYASTFHLLVVLCL